MPRTRDVIIVKVTPLNRGGVRMWVTNFQIDDDNFEFSSHEAPLLSVINDLNIDITTIMTNEHDYANQVVINKLIDVGEQLTEAMLRTPDSSNTKTMLETVQQRLAASASPVLYDFNLPVPLELLTFPERVGGIGAFARMLGGRPQAWVDNGSLLSRAPGCGVAYFHDDRADSVRDGQITNALSQAFPNNIMAHQPLLEALPNEAVSEINRLLRSSNSWAHFQCHTEVRQGRKRMQLSRLFMADQGRFGRADNEMAAVMLNCCGATNRASQVDGATESWSDHFSSICDVPAVIGPFCTVEDAGTIAITQRLYAGLKDQPAVLPAFWAARAACLEGDDYTAFAYRYIGPKNLFLPYEARIQSAPELALAA